MDRKFEGIWIPKELWLDTNLTIREKFFLKEIDSLSVNGYCDKPNSYFARFFKLHRTRCSQIISSLEKKGYIKTTLIRKDGVVKKRKIGVVNKLNRGSEKMIRYKNNISKDISSSLNIKEKDKKESLSKNKDLIAKVVTYLNKCSGSNFKPTTSETVGFINGRLDEKYEWEDFKHVIDVKVAEWLGDNMEKHLNPSCLFRPSNFEKYLNQKLVVEDKNKFRYFKFDVDGSKVYEDENKELFESLKGRKLC